MDWKNSHPWKVTHQAYNIHAKVFDGGYTMFFLGKVPNYVQPLRQAMHASWQGYSLGYKPGDESEFAYLPVNMILI